MSVREETKDLHDAVEETAFAQRLLNCDFTEDDYVRYLQAQYIIFDAMENYFEYTLPHESLKRCEAIEKDLASLGEKPSRLLAPHSACNYTNYILGVNEWKEDSKNAHIYLNYLGMMFGGSIVAKGVPTPGHIYNFENRQECIKAIRELPLDVEQVKQGFRYQIEIMEELEQMHNVAEELIN